MPCTLTSPVNTWVLPSAPCTRTGELVMDVGTVLDGRKAVREKLIDELGGLSDALAWLYREIEGK